MTKAPPQLFDLTLTGQLSLDFANTMDWRRSARPDELLNSYADLVRWSQHTGMLTPALARRVAREAIRRPGEAAATLDRAKDLREALFRIFSATAAGRKPKLADLESLNIEIKQALACLRVEATAKGFVWKWAEDEADLDRIALEVARAAGELLTDNETRARLRECANEGCGWLFIDTSRNRSRRWCSMGVCGNRVKARRHYEQIKSRSG